MCSSSSYDSDENKSLSGSSIKNTLTNVGFGRNLSLDTDLNSLLSNNNFKNASDRNQEQESYRYSRQFTYSAARTIKEACIVLERKFSKKNIVVLTLTCPGSTPRSLKLMEQEAGYMVNRINQRMRYYLKHPYYVRIWEFQSRGALHLHYALYVPDDKDHLFTQEVVRAHWRKILLEVSDNKNCDIFERNEDESWKDDPTKPVVFRQSLKKTLVGYMSKYFSKEVRTVLNGKEVSPGSWYGVSKPLRQAVKEQRLSETFEVDSEETADQIIRTTAQLLDPAQKNTYTFKHKITKADIGYILWFYADKLSPLKDILRMVAKNERENFQKEQ